MHENLARIEVIQEEFENALQKRDKISRCLKSLGFDYVTLTLRGFEAEVWMNLIFGKSDKKTLRKFIEKRIIKLFIEKT